MWVFDGEEWTQDDGGEAKAKRDTTQPQRLEEWEPFAQPQLQIVEITEPRKRREVPPFPLP